jgi:hypothetical protein
MSVIKKIDENSLSRDIKMYCENCFENLVEAHNSNSGSFYKMSGHRCTGFNVWIGKKNIAGYVQVIFPICSECEKKGWK